VEKRTNRVSNGNAYTKNYPRSDLSWILLIDRPRKDRQRYTTITSLKTEVMRVYENPQRLGWDHFVRVRMLIEQGNLINSHLSKQSRYSFNAEHWGSKVMSINWKYILQLWDVRNKELKGETKQ
jgi:hypothetical protein